MSYLSKKEILKITNQKKSRFIIIVISATNLAKTVANSIYSLIEYLHGMHAGGKRFDLTWLHLFLHVISRDFKKLVLDISYGIPEVRLTDGFNAGAYLNKNSDSSETLAINQDMVKKNFVEYDFNEDKIF